MDKSKRIYFYKEDVWTQGDHWMSSASRDIFEHFYKSIKATFLNQFTDPKIKELIEKIYNVRKWESSVFAAYSEAAKNKTNAHVRIYEEKRKSLPEEIEYIGDQIVEKELMTYDKTIYLDFDSFFAFADHGFIKSDKSRDTVYNLWKNFIKDFSIIDLENQLKEELNTALNWEQELKEMLDRYIQSRSELKWHQYLSKNV